MDVLLDQLGLSELRRLKPRQFLSQILNFTLILGTAFMIWKGLSVATDSPSPIVVVLSGRSAAPISPPRKSARELNAGTDSMEPAFQRGDLLFLWNRNLGMNQYAGLPAHSPGTQIGEVVVYNIIGKNIPIVHRVMRRHKGEYVSSRSSLYVPGN